MTVTISKNNHQLFWIRLAVAIGLILLVTATRGWGQSQDSSKNADASAQASDNQRPVLNGTWKLNVDESDDVRQKLRSAMQEREQNGSPGAMGRHGGMGGGGIGMGIPGMGGGMGGPHGQGRGSDEQPARLYDIVRAPDQMTVTQKGAETDITDNENRVRALFTDDRKIEKPKKDSPQTQVKAHWDGQTLSTEEKGPNGEKISHAYELSPDGKQQLVDTLTLESKHFNTPIIVRSVYDKSE